MSNYLESCGLYTTTNSQSSEDVALREEVKDNLNYMNNDLSNSQVPNELITEVNETPDKDNT